MKRSLLILSIFSMLFLLSSCIFFKGELEKVSGPDSMINANEAVFTWKGSIFMGNLDHYEYRKDSGDWISIDTTTYRWSNLSEGHHTFSVRGFDGFGKETDEINWSFQYSNNPAVSFSIEGYVSDSDTNMKLSNAIILCNIYNSQNDVVKTIETRSDGNGYYKLTVDNAGQLDFNELILKVALLGYDIYQEIITEDEIQSSLYNNFELLSVEISEDSKFIAVIDLPGVLEETVFSVGTMFNEFLVSDNELICNNRKNNAVMYIKNKKNNNLGIYIPGYETSRSKTQISSREIVLSYCQYVFEMMFDIEPDVMHKIRDEIVSHHEFDEAVQTYEEEVQKNNFDISTNERFCFLCAKICLSLEFLENNVSRGAYFDGLSTEDISVVDKKWKIKYKNKYPFYIVALKSDGESLGVAKPAGVGWPFGFKQIPTECTLNTSKFFDKYFENKSVYFFVGIGNQMPSDVSESVSRIFEKYNKWVKYINYVDGFCDIPLYLLEVVVQVGTGAPIPTRELFDALFFNLNSIESDIEEASSYVLRESMNMTYTWMNRIKDSLETLDKLGWHSDNWEVMSKSFINVIKHTVNYMPGVKAIFMTNSTSKLADALKFGSKVMSNIAKFLSFTDAIRVGSLAGWRLAYLTDFSIGGAEFGKRPYYPYKSTQFTGYYYFMDISLPENILKNTDVEIQYNGIVLDVSDSVDYSLKQTCVVSREGVEEQFIENEIEYGENILQLNFNNPGLYEVDLTIAVDYGEDDCLYTATKIILEVFGDFKLQYSVDLNSEPSNAGQISFDNINWSNSLMKDFDENTNAEVFARPDYGYRFNGWYENGSLVSYDNPYRFKVSNNRRLEAIFTDAQECTLIVEADPLGKGKVKIDNSTIWRDLDSKIVEWGYEATLTAREEQGYHLEGWYDGRTLLSRDNPYEYVVEDNITITAKFADGAPSVYSPADGSVIHERDIYFTWPSVSNSTYDLLIFKKKPLNYGVSDDYDYSNQRYIYSFGLVMDYSGSMGDEDIEFMEAGAIDFVDYLTSSDEVFITKFATNYNIYPSSGIWSGTDPAVVEHIHKAQERTYTRLWDSVYDSLIRVNNAGTNLMKFLVVFTDGGDNKSENYDYQDCIDYAVENKIMVYGIGFGRDADANLKEVADGTLAKYIFASSQQEITEAFNQIAEDASEKAFLVEEFEGIRDNYKYLLEQPQIERGWEYQWQVRTNTYGNSSLCEPLTFTWE